MKRHHFLLLHLLVLHQSWISLPGCPLPLWDIYLWSCSLSTIISTTTYSGPYQLLLKNVSHLHWKRGEGSRPNLKIFSFFSKNFWTYCLYLSSHLPHFLLSLQFTKKCFSSWSLCWNYFHKNLCSVLWHYWCSWPHPLLKVFIPTPPCSPKYSLSFPSIFVPS